MQPAVLAGLITYITGHDVFLGFRQTFLTRTNIDKIGQLGVTKHGNVDTSDVSTCLTCPCVWNVCEAGAGAGATCGLTPT